VDEIYIRPS